MTTHNPHRDHHDHHESIIIDGKDYTAGHEDLTGRRVLEIAGRHPFDEFLVFWLGPDGVLEDLSLDEEIRTRDRGVQEFLTFRNDRSFRFDLEGQRQDWGASLITEPTLLKLASVGNEYRVWMEQKGEPDRVLNRGEKVDLASEGIEKFYLEKAEPKLVTITINNDKYDVAPGDHKVSELRDIGKIPADEVLSIFKDGGFKPLGENDHVKIKGGEVFASSAMSGGAS